MKMKSKYFLFGFLLVFCSYSCRNKTTFEDVVKHVFEEDTLSIDRSLHDGFDINEIDEQGNNLLHHALKPSSSKLIKNPYAMAKFLISKGININKINNGGFISAQYIVRDSLLLEFFLQMGVETECDSCNAFLIEQALHYYDISKKNVKLILDYGNCHKISCQDLIFNHPDVSLEVIRDLIEKCDSCNIDKPVYNGWNLLHFAVDANRIGMVKLLLEKGINLDIKTTKENKSEFTGISYREGLSALKIAEIDNNEELIGVLKKHRQKTEENSDSR